MKNLLREYINALLSELDDEPRKPFGTLGDDDDQEPGVELDPEQQKKWGWMHPRGQRLALKWSAQSPQLPAEAIARLGVEKDQDIAREYGIPIDVVQWAKVQNSPEILKMLGKVPDYKLGELYDIPYPIIARERLIRGIRGEDNSEISTKFKLKPRKASSRPQRPKAPIRSKDDYSVFDPDAEERKAGDVEGMDFKWEEPDLDD